MAEAIRDQNFVTVALGQSSTSSTTTLPFKIDSSTGRLLVDNASAMGDVVGPASSTDEAIVRFDGTTGKLIQNSSVTIGDSGDISGASLTLSGLTASRAVVTDGSKGLVSSATTGTQLGYLSSATGTTGTTSTNLVFSTSPTLVTPNLGTPSVVVLTNATGLPLTTGVTGTLGVTNGGTGTATQFTAGSVVFAGASGVYSQDNTNFFWNDSTNQLILGNNTSVSVTAGSATFQVQTTALATSSLFSYNNTASGSIATLAHSRGATVGTQATLVADDQLGQFRFEGSDGTTFVRGATITGVADGTVSTGIIPGRLTFSTNNSAGTSLEAVRINSSQMVGIGESSPAARLHLDTGISASAWTTNGIGIRQDSTTYTDTSSSGTVSAVAINSLLGGTIAASSATTYTDPSTIRLVGPTAGTNVTFTNPKVIQTVFTSAGAETMAASFMNSSTTASTGVSLDLNPSTQGSGTRSAQIFAQNNGSNAIALGFRVSNGSTPVEWLRLVASGELIGAYTATLSVSGTANRGLQMYGTNDHAGATFGRFSNNTSAPSISFLKSRGATVGSLGIITNGDELGRIDFAVDDGTDYTSTAARIAVLSDGTPGVDDTPGRLVFYTTPDGSATSSARMSIIESGYVGVGTTTPGDILHARRDSTGDTGLVLQNRNGSGTPETGIRFITGAFDLADSRYSEISSLGGSASALIFKTSNAATPTERMRILANGRIGIGTSSPATLLSVTSTADSASVATATFESDRGTPTANDEVYVSFRLSDSAGNQDEFGRITSIATTVTSTSEVGSLKFSLVSSGSLTDRMVLTNSALTPNANDGIALGTSTLSWADLFLASGAVFNINNGNWVATHTSGILTIGTGELRITSPGTNSASVPSISSTNTLSNKRITKRIVTVNAPGATPTTNTDNNDIAKFTGLATAITSMTTNLSGTPNDGDMLMFQFLDDGTGRGITWGASFAATTVALPTTTVASTLLRVLFQWNSTTSKWECLASI